MSARISAQDYSRLVRTISTLNRPPLNRRRTRLGSAWSLAWPPATPGDTAGTAQLAMMRDPPSQILHGYGHPPTAMNQFIIQIIIQILHWYCMVYMNVQDWIHELVYVNLGKCGQMFVDVPAPWSIWDGEYQLLTPIASQQPWLQTTILENACYWLPAIVRAIHKNWINDNIMATRGWYTYQYPTTWTTKSIIRISTRTVTATIKTSSRVKC